MSLTRRSFLASILAAGVAPAVGLNLFDDYKNGVGFREGQKLRPRVGARPATYGVRDDFVYVIQQNPQAPHKYTVVGEAVSYKEPSRRFIKFEIDGHDWEVAP